VKLGIKIIAICLVALTGLTRPSSASHVVAHHALTQLLGVRPVVPGEEILYSFQAGSDGDAPLAPLIADNSGALYGTTIFGGTPNCFGGCGTVFKLTPMGLSYSETILYSFQGGMDGAGPAAALLPDSAGDLFGTTEYGGGSSSLGSVFELMPSGSGYTERILYRFLGGSDGLAPLSALIADPATGVLYGTTLLGGGATACGSGCGTIYKLTPSGSGYTESVVYAFQSGADGATPGGALLMTGLSTFYGTAATGGNTSCGSAPINIGCGTVFKLTRSGSSYTFKVIYGFQSGTDAANPFATIIKDSSGAFYDTTQNGGSQNLGAVFKLTPSKTGYVESILHNFTGGSDGSLPLAGLLLRAGALYGTAQHGGGARDSGIVFSLTPSGSTYTEHILHQFREGQNTGDGGYPAAGVIAD
jgi:uncharacterized repeat protein (TIGR03803 family)